MTKMTKAEAQEKFNSKEYINHVGTVYDMIPGFRFSQATIELEPGLIEFSAHCTLEMNNQIVFERTIKRRAEGTSNSVTIVEACRGVKEHYAGVKVFGSLEAYQNALKLVKESD